MDNEWYKEANSLTVEKQWKALYDKKMGLRPEGQPLWMRGNPVKTTSILREKLKEIFKQLDIKTFSDIGCGDFLWLSLIDWSTVNYIGYEIIQDLVDRNRKLFPKFQFEKLNIIDTIPPKVDMIFMRSVLVHTNFPNCFKIFKNIKKSESKYLMVSTCVRRRVNYEPICLMLQHQNLMRPPFNFPEPMILTEEMVHTDSDNYIGVWRIDEL